MNHLHDVDGPTDKDDDLLLTQFKHMPQEERNRLFGTPHGAQLLVYRLCALVGRPGPKSLFDAVKEMKDKLFQIKGIVE